MWARLLTLNVTLHALRREKDCVHCWFKILICTLFFSVIVTTLHPCALLEHSYINLQDFHQCNQKCTSKLVNRECTLYPMTVKTAKWGCNLKPDYWDMKIVETYRKTIIVIISNIIIFAQGKILIDKCDTGKLHFEEIKNCIITLVINMTK